MALTLRRERLGCLLLGFLGFGLHLCRAFVKADTARLNGSGRERPRPSRFATRTCRRRWRRARDCATPCFVATMPTETGIDHRVGREVDPLEPFGWSDGLRNAVLRKPSTVTTSPLRRSLISIFKSSVYALRRDRVRSRTRVYLNMSSALGT